MKACEEGILAGYRVVDVKVEFYDGKMHPVDSKDIAFQIAGYFAFKEAFAEMCIRDSARAGHGDDRFRLLRLRHGVSPIP